MGRAAGSTAAGEEFDRPVAIGDRVVIRESAAVAPEAWRRCLAFFLDGLRAEAAHRITVPPLTAAQLAKVGQAGDGH